MIFIKRSLRPLDDCFLKPLVRPLETFKKVVRKIKANPFERFCRSLDFFAYTFKPLANPLRALEKPLTSRSLAVSFYPLNGKPLVYVFLEKVTNVITAHKDQDTISLYKYIINSYIKILPVKNNLPLSVTDFFIEWAVHT